MAGRLFFDNIKILLRTREAVFWALLYPLLMATLFHFAFGNLGKADAFSPVPAALVAPADFPSTPFYTALAAVSDVDGAAHKDDLFQVTLSDQAQADAMLESASVKGYIVYTNEEGPALVVSGSGFAQTLLQSYLDAYLQAEATARTLLAANPAAAPALYADLGNRITYLQEQQGTRRPMDTTVIYYYALLAMTCLMGSTIAVDEVIKVQANMSARAARLNAAPVPKFRLFLCNIAGVLLFEILVTLALLAYLALLGVDFGPRIGYVVLTCALGAISGVFLGTTISVGVKSEGLKYGVAIGATVFTSFLSGMMWPDMKYLVHRYAPVVAYLSPANLISDALYSLYCYDGLTRYAADMFALLALSALLCAITCLALRRQSYASI